MIQDIYPHKLNNQYKVGQEPTGDCLIIHFSEDGRLLIKDSKEPDGSHRKILPRLKEFSRMPESLTYLFSMDDDCIFIAEDENVDVPDGYTYMKVREVRRLNDVSKKSIFEAFTAKQLGNWYRNNKYCGRCGSLTSRSLKERAIVCSNCNNTIYPRVVPAVIVGVINKGKTTEEDRILLTKYNTGIGYYALVAGFTEIGETLEETVEREVMEETGLKVKNLRYYKSQPWGVVDDLLAGFYCEVDGDDTITRDETELAVARWCTRDEVVLQPDQLSLTNEMMTRFKEGYDCLS